MKTCSLIVLAGVAAAIIACDFESTAPYVGEPVLSTGSRDDLHRHLAQARAGTARFQDVRVALAEGYEPFSECVDQPGLGGMGIHFGKLSLAADAGFSPGEPEILLYEPRADGSLKLVGVEYAILQDAWHAAGNSGPPTFYGHPFDAAPGAYVLHAWIWKHNPAGTFAAYNPGVSCPAGAPGHVH